jgi:signal transduction histidine kinase
LPLLPDFRVRQRDYLLEISRSITQELDLERLLTRILDISIEMLAGQAGLIALRSMPGGWTIDVSKGISASFLRQIEPLLAEVPEREEPAEFELPEINRLLQGLTRAASLGLLTGVVLPLIARKLVIGVIFIFRNYAAVFSSNDTALLRSFADQAAIAVHNAKLYSQVSHDKMRLDALLDSVADGILILNPGHVIEHCNPAFSRLVSIPISQIRDRQHDEIVTLLQPKNGLTLSKAEAGGWPLSSHASLYIEGDLQKQSGLILPVGITYASVFSGDGMLMNIIASVRDISRFREAEELKSTFVSVISHELKTPVALIKGYVSTLRRDDVSWDREIVDDSLQVIEEEADRLTELIENLLDASRLQAGALAINMTDLAIDQLAKRIAERFRTQTHDHRISTDFAPDFPPVLADETRIGQVISNLISNAIKYSPSGGEIQISGMVRPESVIISVSDQGSGISPGDLPHVFDRFYRSKDASRTTKGAGLGLYLSKAVIEAHGGQIWIEPGSQSGTTISFSLPRDVYRVHPSTKILK